MNRTIAVDRTANELLITGGWAEVLHPGPSHPLEHQLESVLPVLATCRKRKHLLRSASYREHQSEIERVLHGFEWNFELRQAPSPHPQGALRAVAWNCERGKRFDALVDSLHRDPRLTAADFLLLTELDIGMGRSGNRNVPAELAERLGYDYVFANFHLLLSAGDRGERQDPHPNGLAMHGAALLSRFPITRFGALSIPEYFDKFEVPEKRLGSKRVLFCEVELCDGPLTIIVVHLDPFCGPKHRVRQAQAIVDALGRFGGRRVLLGGDLNTHTYDFDSKLALAFQVFHKLVRFGFTGTVDQYLTPDHVFERDVFRTLRSAQICFDAFGDPRRGTLDYDLRDPDVLGKSLDEVPPSVMRWLRRRLAPWDGCVPMRFDWFGGRGIRALDAQTLPKPRVGKQHVSDHAPIYLEFMPAPLRTLPHRQQRSGL